MLIWLHSYPMARGLHLRGVGWREDNLAVEVRFAGYVRQVALRIADLSWANSRNSKGGIYLPCLREKRKLQFRGDSCQPCRVAVGAKDQHRGMDAGAKV